MPLRTEYSCRLREPKEFQKKSFRRISSGDVDLIIARPYGMKKTRAQAIRYPREIWDEKDAKRSCRKRQGTFEPVSGDLGRIRQRLFVISIRYPYEHSFRRIGTVGGKPESEQVKQLYQQKGFHVRVKKV